MPAIPTSTGIVLFPALINWLLASLPVDPSTAAQLCARVQARYEERLAGTRPAKAKRLAPPAASLPPTHASFVSLPNRCRGPAR